MPIDLDSIRAQFPILEQTVNKRPLVYFDNGATNQKPLMVTDAIVHYYQTINSNVHRGVHTLSQLATDAFEQSRKTVQQFIHAAHEHEVIFTRGTTESINLVAYSFGKAYVKAGDNIVISTMEHHSNIVPWQMMCEERGASMRVIKINEAGELDMDHLQSLLDERTKLLSVTHVSNVLGTINPVKRIVEICHAANVPVMLDGAQAVSHLPVDVQALGCDFYSFSGHKMYGPMGIGILYGREALLNEMPPWQGGGEMIKNVSFEKTTYNELPYKFEAGTPNVADAIGLQKAIEFMQQIGIPHLTAHEHDLTQYAMERLTASGGIRLIGTAAEKTSVVSFLIDNIHPYDAGTILDKLGFAVRTGTHCAEPLMQHYGIHGTVRASFAAYNSRNEIDRFIEAIEQVKNIFA